VHANASPLYRATRVWIKDERSCEKLLAGFKKGTPFLELTMTREDQEEEEVEEEGEEEGDDENEDEIEGQDEARWRRGSRVEERKEANKTLLRSTQRKALLNTVLIFPVILYSKSCPPHPNLPYRPPFYLSYFVSQLPLSLSLSFSMCAHRVATLLLDNP